jgi:mannose-6-phosphate isomerase-like protein (cupin superfamily)
MRAGGQLEVLGVADLQPSTPAGHWGVDSRFILRDVDRLVFQRCEMAPRGGADSHMHEEQDQIFYMLAGSLRVTDGDGRSVMLSAGDALLIPAGVPHATFNDAAATASYLVLTYPT